MRKLFMCLLFVAVCVGAGADSPANPSFIPAEWYQNLSLFFRTATNPPKVIPVMASDGYRLPVAIEGAVSVTVGSATFTAMPIYSNSAGSATLGLVDAERRLVVNLGSDTIGLVTELLAIEAEIASSSASSTVDLQTLQASLSAKIAEHMAQQATETADILSILASHTLEVGSVTAKIEELRAQNATSAIDNLAALATITLDMASLSSDIGRVETTLKPISTPTRTEMVSDTVVAAITPTAGRIWIKVQNKSSTEEVTLDFVNTVTPGNGDTIYPGSHILLPVDASVPIYVISSSAAPVSILEATR
jgi:hypothetical protein